MKKRRFFSLADRGGTPPPLRAKSAKTFLTGSLTTQKYDNFKISGSFILLYLPHLVDLNYVEMITAPKNAIAYLVCLISYMCIAPKRNESTFPRAPLRTISDLLTRKATTTSNDEDHESDHWLEHWASRFIYNERLMSAMYLLNLTL